MIEFAWPWLFAALPLPLLARLLLPPARENSGAALRIPFYSALENITTHNSSAGRAQSRARWLAAWLIWLLLVTASARPQWLGEPVEMPVSGRDLLLAVDLSGSMETPDMSLKGEQVNRLSMVKTVLNDFIARREGDRVGLILFGEHAYLQTPLTFDRKTVRGMLLESFIGLAGDKTAIGDAVGLAVKRLRERPRENRVLILLTDGANTAGEVAPLKAAELAAQAGVKIYTIGVGADSMVISGFFGRQRVNPSADLDEKTLKGMAEATGGLYFRAKDTEQLERIYRELDRLEPVEVEKDVFRPVKALYYWPLGAAFSLFALGALLFLRTR